MNLGTSSGSSLVGFIQSGAGAVARTQEGKSRDVVSVKDFGAKGDGATNDSAAVQAALTAAAGNVLLLPPLTYKFVTGLTVPANTWIVAWGATLDFSASHMTGLTFANGGGIIGAKSIVGAGNAAYNAAGIAISCVGTNNAPGAPTYVTGPTVQQCNFSGWGAYGVYMQYCTAPLIEKNTFTNIGYAAVMGLSCTGGRADKNTIQTVSPGTNANAYGISWSRNEGTLVADPRCLNCYANENVIDGIPLWEGLDTHAGDGITFRGNKISNCKTGISCTGSLVSGVALLAPKRCNIEDNTVAGLNTGSCFRISGVYNAGVVSDYAEQCTVRGNKLTGGGIVNTNLGSLWVQATKDLNVNGGTIVAAQVNGIGITSDNMNFNISGVTITDPWDNTSGAVACILQTGNNNTGYIGGNTFAYHDSTLGTHVATCSLRFNAGTTGNDINVGRNEFAGIAAGILSIVGSTVAGVNISGAYAEGGTATIAVVNGVVAGFVDVTFAKLFPVLPRVKPTFVYPIDAGGKLPIPSVSLLTTSGFRIIVQAYDAGAWIASGNITVAWEAST